MKTFRLTLLTAIALLVLTSLFAGAKSSRVSDEDRRRADYTYLEAMKYKAREENDVYASLLARAFELNPEDETIGYYHGLIKIGLSNGDSAEVNDGAKLMARYVNNNPEDYTNAVRFAGLLQRVGDPDAALTVWEKVHHNFPDRPEFAYQYATLLARQGDSADVRRAIAVMDTLQDLQGKTLGIVSNKIQLLYQLEDTAAMLRELHALLADGGANSVQNIVFAGDVFSAINERDSALAYFNRACEIDSASGLAYYSRAEYFRGIGDSTAYDREIFNALSHDNLDLDTKLELMKAYVSVHIQDSLQHDRLNDLFRILITKHPHQASLHGMYAQFLIMLRDWPEAAEQQEYYVSLSPEDLGEWQRLAALYAMADNYPKAIESARDALRYNPDNVDLFLQLASFYAQEKDEPNSLKYYREALRVTPETDPEKISNIYGGIGDLYFLLEKGDSAYAYYGKSLEINPDNLIILNNYAYNLALEDRDLDQALQMIERVVLAKPEDATSLDTYAWVLFKMKDYQKAKTYIEKALEFTEEPSSDVYDHAGDIYFMNGEKDVALDFWKEALRLDPKNTKIERKVSNETIFFD